jgi:hypothetical protein
LQEFLAEGGLEVLDVARGTAAGTRRLVVGDQRASAPSHVVSVAGTSDGSTVVDAEASCVDHLQQVVRSSMRETLPAVVGKVDVGGLPGVVFSAVPGLQPHSAPGRVATAGQAGAVLAWLTALWSDTSGREAQVDLGSEAQESLTARYSKSPRAASALAALQRSRAALAVAQTQRTVSHGCPCPRHLLVGEGGRIGADDWGIARFDAEPLRDVGTWVVRASGSGIGGVFAARSGSGRRLRDFVADGLGHWGLPSGLWRDVLVVALADAAADGLAEQDTSGMELFAAISDRFLATSTDRGSTMRTRSTPS